MKIVKTKKTGLFVAMLGIFLLAVTLVAGIHSGHSSALVDPGSGNGDSFVFQDRANIIGTFSGGNKVTFTDVNPTDSDRNYVPMQSDFCKPSSGTYGITIPRNADLTSPTITGQLLVGTSTGNNCNGSPQSISIVNPQNPVPVAAATFEWDTNNIVTFPNETARNLTFTKVAGAQGSHDVYFSDKSAGDCPENGAIVLTQGQNIGSYFILSSLPVRVPANISSTSYQLLYNTGAVDTSKCYIAQKSDVSNIFISGTQGQPAPNSASGGVTTTSGPGTCEDSGWALDWIFCPTLEAADKISQATIGLFESQLSFKVSDLSRNNGADRTHLSWSLIRDISSALLVIIMLVMVISQATGGGPFEAYTIRKMLPKLVIAIILIQLSWTLLSYVVSVFDDIGHGLKEILYLPFQPARLDDFGFLLKNAGIGDLQAGTFSWIAVLGIGIGVAIALPAILGFAFAAIVADLVGLSTLIFRKIIILMALIMAPIAILLWILPGTNRYFKLWWDNLIKALMMYPLVIGIIAAGRIFAYVIGTTGNGTFLNFFLVTVAFFAPLFLLPKTFKWGGGAMKFVGEKAFEGTNKYITGKDAKPMKYFGNRQEDWNNRRRARSQLRVANGVGFEATRPSSYWQTPLDKFRSHEWDPLLQGETNRSSKRSKMMQYKEAGHKVEEEEQNLSDREAAFEEKRLNQSQYNHDYLWQDKADGELANYEGNEVVRVDELDEKDKESHQRYSNDYFNEWQKRNPGGTPEEFARRGRMTYAERDYYRWKQANPGGTFEQFKKDKNAYGYKDYSGKIVDVKKPEDKYQRNAALNMLAKFGGPNHPMLVRYMYQEINAGGKREQEMREWMQDHSEFILKVYPQLLKGLTSTATQPSFVGMHPVGFRDQIGRLMYTVNHGQTTGDKERAKQTLRQMVSNLVANMNSTERNGIETDIRVLMKAIAQNNGSKVEKINERDILPHEFKDGIVDKDTLQSPTKGRTLPPIELTDGVRQALTSGAYGDQDLLAQIDQMVEADTGAYTSGSGSTASTARVGTGPAPHADRDFSDSRPPEGGGHREFNYAPSHEAVVDRAIGQSEPVGPSTSSLGTAAAPSTASVSIPAQSIASTSQGGSFEPAVQNQPGRVTERVISSPSPTIISPTNTTTIIQQAAPDGSQVVYSRAPVAAPARTGSLDRQSAEELDYELRNVYRELKKLGARNQVQQHQFEQLRSEHPNWDSEE